MKHGNRLAVCAAAVLCAGLTAGAQETLDLSRRTALVTAIEKAGPAVVTINTVKIRRERFSDPFYDLFLFGPAPVREEAVEGIGSGFIVDEKGHILTNYHVLQDADAISSVTLPNGRRLDVDLVGADEISKIPLGAIGIYSYADKIKVGLQQLMAGARCFNTESITRRELMSLTEECAKVTGIPYLMDCYRSEAMDILNG